MLVCLARSRSWAHAPASLTSEVVVHARVNPTLRRWRLEDQKLKVILGYVVSFRPLWATMRPCLKINQSVKGVGTPDPHFGSARIITVFRTVFKIKKEGRKK